jgi:hypothetical protein
MGVDGNRNNGLQKAWTTGEAGLHRGILRYIWQRV